MIRAISLSLLLAACGSIPQDPDGTSEAIASRGYIRVGIAADMRAIPSGEARARDLIGALGAPAQVVRGSTEPLLGQLEEGELDLVLSPLAADTPWAKRVTLGPALAAAGVAGRTHEVRPAMRLGENQFIGRVHRAALAVGGTP
jgi:hypothetical protein